MQSKAKQAKRKALLELNNGEKAEITEIKCCGPTRGRLMSFGMILGRIVTCVDKIRGGPVILEVHELKVAVGRKAASMCECRLLSHQGNEFGTKINSQKRRGE